MISTFISKGKNVALWKSTNQSSDYSKERPSSDKAVDGNDDGNFGSGTCTHTSTNPQDNNPTWNVNLGNAYYIIAIKIKNRNDIRKLAYFVFMYFFNRMICCARDN